MTRATTRRDQLAEAATDYALAHGLIDLSLRPLAAALGTSDRMLLYHFDGKDDLVATVLRVSNDRSVAQVLALEPARGVREAVLALWAVIVSPELNRCQGIYVEAAALGLLGREPYAGVVREANGRWVAALTDFLVASGVPPDRAGRAVVLVDAAFMGFQLDLPLEEGLRSLDQAVLDLAEAVAVVTERS
jgi:AcrR family transcriptional regulator